MKLIYTLLLCLALAVSGFPVQAVESCSMMDNMNAMVHSMKMGKDCKDCANHSNHDSSKKICCEKSCASQCSSAGNVGNADLIAFESPDFASSVQKFSITDGYLPSYLLQTQERPPKHFS